MAQQQSPSSEHWTTRARRERRQQPHTCRAASIAAQRPSPRAPGELLARLITWLGFKESDGCACRAVRHMMNHWGWRGCLRYERVIREHLVYRAKAERVPLAGRGWQALAVALLEVAALGAPARRR